MAGDIKVAVVSGQISSSDTGTADFTKSGFGTPKACIVILSEDVVDDTSTSVHSRVSIGFSDFTNDFCIGHQDENNQAKVDCDAIKSNTSCYIALSSSGSILRKGTASTITDGVRLTNTLGLAAPFATVIMFGGADLQVSLDSISVQNDFTTQVATGIDQDLVFFIGSDISGEDSSSAGINNFFGVCHIDTSDHTTFVQRCISWSSDHNNAAGAPSAVLRTDRVAAIVTEAGGEDWSARLSSATTTQYRITHSEADPSPGSGMEIYGLALDLDDRGSNA